MSHFRNVRSPKVGIDCVKSAVVGQGNEVSVVLILLGPGGTVGI